MTERADSVLHAPAQVLAVEQRPTELVAIPVSHEAEPSSEIGQHGSSSVASTAGKETRFNVRLPKEVVKRRGTTRKEKLAGILAARVSV